MEVQVLSVKVHRVLLVTVDKFIESGSGLPLVGLFSGLLYCLHKYIS